MKNNILVKTIKGTLLAAALTTVLAACGNKNNTTTPLNAYTQSCVNCDNITGYPFFTAQTQAYSMRGYNYISAMTISWSFSGQNTNTLNNGQNYNQWASPAMNYAGQVSAAGKVNVSSSSNLGFCPLPAGEYNLTTQTVGQWNQGQISGLKLLITGPATATAVVNQAQAYEYGYGYGYGGGYGGGYWPGIGNGSGSGSSRVQGYLVIEQVNGIYCHGAQLAIY